MRALKSAFGDEAPSSSSSPLQLSGAESGLPLTKYRPSSCSPAADSAIREFWKSESAGEDEQVQSKCYIWKISVQMKWKTSSEHLKFVTTVMKECCEYFPKTMDRQPFYLRRDEPPCRQSCTLTDLTLAPGRGLISHGGVISQGRNFKVAHSPKTKNVLVVHPCLALE